MKIARDLLIEVKTLHKDEYITRARQLLRDDVYREIYITDEKKTRFRDDRHHRCPQNNRYPIECDD